MTVDCDSIGVACDLEVGIDSRIAERDGIRTLCRYRQKRHNLTGQPSVIWVTVKEDKPAYTSPLKWPTC